MLEVQGRVWIGDDQEPFGNGDVGALSGFDENLYTLLGDPSESWESDERVGSAHCIFVPTGREFAVCTLVLEFGRGSTLVATGSLPLSGSSIGDGVLAVAGGTGDHESPPPRLSVTSKNPHKYSNQ
jgi:hypothetical protein